MHQIWLGDKQLPEQSLLWKEHWDELHPDWNYHLWTDSDVQKIQDEKLKRLLDVPQAMSSRANILRVYIVLKYGGFYFDIDFDWNKNFDEFTRYKSVCCKEIPERYNNAFFGAEKNNEWVSFMWENIDECVYKTPPWGPTFFTYAVSQKGDTLTTLPTEYIYPYLWDEPYKDRTLFPDCYAIHHWFMTWNIKI
jgi:mannosyltransferase OCH1-like enzyme